MTSHYTEETTYIFLSQMLHTPYLFLKGNILISRFASTRCRKTSRMHTTKEKMKRNKKKGPTTAIDSSQQQNSYHHQIQHPGNITVLKSNTFKKGTMHKHRRCPIKDFRFSPWRKSALPKQFLQQGNRQAQPMKAKPWFFSLKVMTRHPEEYH